MSELIYPKANRSYQFARLEKEGSVRGLVIEVDDHTGTCIVRFEDGHTEKINFGRILSEQ